MPTLHLSLGTQNCHATIIHTPLMILPVILRENASHQENRVQAKVPADERVLQARAKENRRSVDCTAGNDNSP